VRIGNVIANNSNEIVNNFGEYFGVVAQQSEAELSINTHEHYNPLPLDRCCNAMVLCPVTSAQCFYIISSLKNSSQGLNQMSTYLLKNGRDYLQEPLTELINYSFRTGSIPDAMKIACITPIHKSGDSTEVNNYRPIPVIPLFAKILEKCMYKRLTKFLGEYGILSEQQFGFRRGKFISK